MNAARLQSEKGFSLLEVLIAMSIFSVASLGVLGMVASSMQLTANSRQSQEANLLAGRLLEEFQSLPPETPSITGCTGGCWVTGTDNRSAVLATIGMPELAGAPATAASTRYQVKWSSDNPSPKVRHYAVTVAWPRNRESQTLREGDTNFVNCSVAAANCFRVEFHTYRALP